MISDKEKIISKIARYYLFHGSNEYLIKERISSLIAAVIPPGGEVFDLDRFDGKRCDIADLLNSVSTSPALGPLRITILDNTERLSPKAQNLLLESLPMIPEYSVLVMICRKVDKRQKLLKTLVADKKAAHRFDDFDHGDAVALLEKFASDRGRKMEAQLADAMVGIYGPDPFRLENEIEKLALLAGEREQLGKRDLAFISGFSKVETAYDLPDLVFDGKIEEALRLASRAMASGISESQILYIIKNYLDRMNGTCEAADFKGLMSSHRLPYPVARQIFARAKRIKPSAILSCLSYIFKAEYALKSARFPSKMIIELLIVVIYLASGGNKRQS